MFGPSLFARAGGAVRQVAAGARRQAVRTRLRQQWQQSCRAQSLVAVAVGEKPKTMIDVVAEKRAESELGGGVKRIDAQHAKVGCGITMRCETHRRLRVGGARAAPELLRLPANPRPPRPPHAVHRQQSTPQRRPGTNVAAVTRKKKQEGQRAT